MNEQGVIHEQEMEARGEESRRGIRSREECEDESLRRGAGSEGASTPWDRDKESVENIIVSDKWLETSQKVLSEQACDASDLREGQARRCVCDEPERIHSAPQIKWSGQTARIGFRFVRWGPRDHAGF